MDNKPDITANIKHANKHNTIHATVTKNKHHKHKQSGTNIPRTANANTNKTIKRQLSNASKQGKQTGTPETMHKQQKHKQARTHNVSTTKQSKLSTHRRQQ